jgi:hypothetical protein
MMISYLTGLPAAGGGDCRILIPATTGTFDSDIMLATQDHKWLELSHTFLRLLLSTYSGIAPSRIGYRYSRTGKPFLADNIPSPGRLEFNLSHSERLVAIGVSAGFNISIDVEEASILQRLGNEDFLGLSPIFSSEEQSRRQAGCHSDRVRHGRRLAKTAPTVLGPPQLLWRWSYLNTLLGILVLITNHRIACITTKKSLSFTAIDLCRISSARPCMIP